jgi:hypothetical protein
LSRKEAVESQSEKKSSSKSLDISSMSMEQKLRRYVGIACAGVLKAAEATAEVATGALALQAVSGLGRIEGSRAPGNGKEGDAHAVARVGNDTAVGKAVALDQQSRATDNSQSERAVPALPEALTHPNGPTVEQIWPRLYQQMVESSGEKGKACENALQGDAQERYDGETSSGLREQKIKHPTSNEKQLKIVQNVMEEFAANPDDPKVRENARKLLAEIKGEKSTEPGKESSEVKEQVSQSTKEIHQGEPGKMAQWQALMDKIKAHPEGRKLLASKEASPPSSEAAPPSSKDIHTQDSSGPCLQWGPTSITDVNVQVVPADDGGTQLQVNRNFHVQNICPDLVSGMTFQSIDSWTCPENCASTSDTDMPVFSGSPTSIGQNQFSVGLYSNSYVCIESDDNGNPVSVAPNSFLATGTAQGRQNGNLIYSGVFEWNFNNL